MRSLPALPLHVLEDVTVENVNSLFTIKFHIPGEHPMDTNLVFREGDSIGQVRLQLKQFANGLGRLSK